MTLKELEQEVAQDGLGHDQILSFFRLLPTCAAVATLAMLDHWIADMRAAGADIDEYWLDRVQHDFDRHGRLMPETIIGADHAPYVSLNHSKEEHFAH